ncbi:uncharacterized protein LOC110450873 [Mizuhopecten yessoensis]|uniref:Uncharacterized protein n=1 Tax=Mizuhopecten yessoensis TaxID=6573 RepID=A0A210QN18_MIZYE|nr:uncharacterized protein LOC110450873 [Mizuhopecten yessoensis]OWF50136.1 hypothetical protein KP79_PYT14094 [Mizuhopecten yessoensis]
MPLAQRESDVEIVKNEVLRRKGKMTRISEHRRELAAAKREAREKEKRVRLEEKLMKIARQKDGEIEKDTVNDRLQRAKVIRKLNAEEIRRRTEANQARVSRTENANKISTEERMERARQKREKRLTERREKWEKKESRIEEMKRRRRVNTPKPSLPNIEI